MKKPNKRDNVYYVYPCHVYPKAAWSLLSYWIARRSIYFKVLARSHVSNMHYASFSMQDNSHDWNRIQTWASVTYKSLRCQFSNAESYEYFMEPQSLSFFRALCKLSHQIDASLHYIAVIGRSYHTSAYAIGDHLMSRVIIPLC